MRSGTGLSQFRTIFLPIDNFSIFMYFKKNIMQKISYGGGVMGSLKRR